MHILPALLGRVLAAPPKGMSPPCFPFPFHVSSTQFFPCFVCFQKKTWYDHEDYPFIDKEGKKVRQSKVIKAREKGLADEFTLNLRAMAPVSSYNDDTTAKDGDLYYDAGPDGPEMVQLAKVLGAVDMDGLVSRELSLLYQLTLSLFPFSRSAGEQGS